MESISARLTFCDYGLRLPENKVSVECYKQESKYNKPGGNLEYDIAGGIYGISHLILPFEIQI